MTTKSYVVKGQLPCPQEDCTSSDGYFEYNDGHGFCFSCRQLVYKNDTVVTKDEASYHEFIHSILPLDYISNIKLHSDAEYIPRRGLSHNTTRTYDITSYLDTKSTEILTEFPYTTGFKYKWWDEARGKNAYTQVGNTVGLFGQHLFSGGCAKAITITEGEDDAASVYQMMGSKWPSVSVKSSSTALKDCKDSYNYLNSFLKIYLCFDNDKQGQKAVKDVASLFDNRKLYHVKMSKYKDANEYLANGHAEEFRRVWFNAPQFRPEGIVSGLNSFREILTSEGKKESISYPFSELQQMTKGMRKGEIVLITAKRGQGKTEFIRALEFNILKKTTDAIGIIHLEEGKVRALKGLAGLQVGRPMNMPDSPDETKEIMDGLEKLVEGDDKRLHLYTHFGSNNPDIILDNIRYMVTSLDCKWIFLDHITMVVTGLYSTDQTAALDYISTQLGMMVEELEFGLVIVSHVNDEGLTRGSRNIENIAWLQIHFERDHLNSDPRVRDISQLTITKNRAASETGPAGQLFFDKTTFALQDMKPTDKEQAPWSSKQPPTTMK